MEKFGLYVDHNNELGVTRFKIQILSWLVYLNIIASPAGGFLTVLILALTMIMRYIVIIAVIASFTV